MVKFSIFILEYVLSAITLVYSGTNICLIIFKYVLVTYRWSAFLFPFLPPTLHSFVNNHSPLSLYEIIFLRMDK